MNFRFCDTMGLGEETKGMDITDFIHILDGQMVDRYEFKPGQRLTDDIELRANIDLGDKIHVVALVIDAVTVNCISQSVKDKILQVQKEAADKAIPVLVILTKIDKICAFVESDVTKGYRSTAVRAAVEKVANISSAQVIPVKNYESETELSDGVDILALLAMRQLVRQADSFFDDRTLHSDIPSKYPADQDSAQPALLPHDKPWRKGVDDLIEEKRNALKKEIEEYSPLGIVGVKHVNILMAGQIGAGKSSFFNTINSVFRGHVTAQAAAGSDPNSLTNTYRKYAVRNERKGRPLRFRLYDTMGLEENKGLDTTDFRLLLEGNIKDNQKLQSGARLRDDVEETPTTLEEKMHVVAIVIDASCVEYMKLGIREKLRDIRQDAKKLNIPVLAILTNIDKSCAEVKQDILKVYQSTAVWECLKKAADALQIPPANVIPVQNYVEGTELEVGVDVLALHAMRQLLRLADNYFDDYLSKMNISTLPEEGSFLLPDPWRKENTDFGLKAHEQLVDYVKMYKPSHHNTSQASILLIGCQLSGKSSFINTIASVYADHVVTLASSGADRMSGTSKTMPYQILQTSGQSLNFALVDTPGLFEDGQNTAVYDDVLALLKHQKLGKADSQIHIVAFVIDAYSVGKMPEALTDQLNRLRRAALGQGVPVAVILTKIDKVCTHVNKKVEDLCRSSNVRDCVTDVAEMMNVTPAQVLPIRNYEKETELIREVDVLTLYAIRQLLRLVNDSFQSSIPQANAPRVTSAASGSEMAPSGVSDEDSASVTNESHLPLADDLRMTTIAKGVDTVEYVHAEPTTMLKERPVPIGSDGKITPSDKEEADVGAKMESHRSQATETEEYRQQSDVVLAALDPTIRKRLAALLSIATQTRGGHPQLFEMLPHFEAATVQGNSRKEATICVVEWMANKGYTVEDMGNIFKDFDVQPDIYTLMKNMTLPGAVMRDRNGHPTIHHNAADHHHQRKGEPKSNQRLEIAAAREQEHVVVECSSELTAEREAPSGDEEHIGVIVTKIADMMSDEFPDLLVKSFRYYRDRVLVVYCDIDETKQVTDRNELYERAKSIMGGKVVVINEKDTPMLKLCCGLQLGIGGTITSSRTESSGRVAGFLSPDGGANVYATTVAHLFQDTPGNEVGEEDCLLVPYQGSKQFFAKCIAKSLNVESTEKWLRSVAKTYYDICFVESQSDEGLQPEWISNVLKVSGGEPGMELRLSPSLSRGEKGWTWNGIDVYVYKIARKGIAPKGTIEYIQMTRNGIPTFMGIKPFEAQDNPMTEEGDSGCLVTKTTPIETGVVPDDHMDKVEAVGIVVGVDEENITVALPIWPQLQKLCCDHDFLRDKTDYLSFKE